MKIAIFQPYFFPYIGHFQLINAVDRFVFYSDIDYISCGWINRNRITLKNRGDLYITVPIRYNNQIRIKDVVIDNTLQWSCKILRDIFHNYKKAPFFDELYPLLEELFVKRTYSTITELNEVTIRATADFLDIRTEFVSDHGRYPDLEKKLASMQATGYEQFPVYEQKQVSRMQIRPLEICRIEQADHLINAIGGVSLYDKQIFEYYGIKLSFIQTHEIRYNQMSENFIPNLSIIDALMHNGKERTKELLTYYTLI